MNQLIISIIITCLCLLSQFSQIHQCFAQEQNPPLGPVGFLEYISKDSQNQYNRLLKQIKQEPIKYEEADLAENIFINPDYLSLIFLYSDDKDIAMSRFNSCNFLALLQLKRLKDPRGSINQLLIDVMYKDKKHENETRLISIDDFLKIQYSKECFNNLELSKIYNSEILKKQALKDLKIKIPRTDEECLNIYQDFFKSTDSIYLCQLIQLTSSAKTLNQTLSASSLFFLENICKAPLTEKEFCKNYKNDSYWNKVLSKEKDITPLLAHCMGILKKTKLEQKDYGICLSLMDKTPELCLFNNSFLFPSLSPRPNCSQISEALMQSRIYMGHKDCPSQVDNDGIVNTFRILYHFLNGQEKSIETLYPLSEYVDNCKSHPLSLFANLMLKQPTNNIWKYEICYTDPIENKETCLPSNGTYWQEDPLSEDLIIAQIIKRIKPAPKNLTCTFISTEKYKPHLLSFQKGCFIVYNSKQCTGMNCPKKVMYKGSIVNNISFHTGTLFDYFPSSIQKNHYAISSMINDTIKSISSPKEIRNSTQLKFILNIDDKTLIHGQACAEDLLPTFFYKTSFNQCSPLTFIIDGFKTIQNRDYVIIRTAIEDIHSPRILPWTQIYDSVKTFSELHPMKKWTLYAIRK